MRNRAPTFKKWRTASIGSIRQLPFPMAAPFNFNQYLIVDDAPMLFHTGLRRCSRWCSEAIDRVMPVEQAAIRCVLAFRGRRMRRAESTSWRRAQRGAGLQPGRGDDRDRRLRRSRAARARGRRGVGRWAGDTMRWFDTPHVPHGWECGFMMDLTTRTLFCGDLFTQGGCRRGRLTEPTSWVRARRSVCRWITSRTRRRRAAMLGAPGRTASRPPRLHARQRVARRRCGVAPRACRDFETNADAASCGVD